MMKTLIALALSAALIAPAMGGPGLPPSCTTYTPRDTLNARSLPGAHNVIVGEFEHGTRVWWLDGKTVNGHRWAFVSGTEPDPVTGWVFAGYLTGCNE